MLCCHIYSIGVVGAPWCCATPRRPNHWRCGLLHVAHLGDAAPFFAGHPINEVLARMFPVLPLGFAAVCEWWCRSFKISARDLQDALPEDAHVEPLERVLRRWPVSWPRGVTVSTLDSESSDRGSNPREASLCTGFAQHSVLSRRSLQ